MWLSCSSVFFRVFRGQDSLQRTHHPILVFLIHAREQGQGQRLLVVFFSYGTITQLKAQLPVERLCMHRDVMQVHADPLIPRSLEYLPVSYTQLIKLEPNNIQTLCVIEAETPPC